MSFDISGFTAGLQQAQKHVVQRAESGLEAAAEQVLREAQALVPDDTGALQASGQVDVDGDTATISFGTDHAIYAHEMTDNDHNDGQAHFLSDPLIKGRLQAGQTIADHLRQGS